MAYTPTNWQDRSVTRPRTYTSVTNGDSSITLTPSEGTVNVAGTPVNATAMNKIETELVYLDGAVAGKQSAIPPNNCSATTALIGLAAVGITWTDPIDTVLGDNAVVNWAGTKLVRKVGSYPANETDGTVVVNSTTRNQYQSVGFVDTGLTNGTQYYYQVFPYSTLGAVNRNAVAANRATGTPLAQNTIIITTSGPVAIPPGLSLIDLYMSGGGGSGGGNGASNSSGGGGGGYTKTYKSTATGYKDGGAIAVNPYDIWTVTIGAGGGAVSGTVNGATGGQTSFVKGGTSYIAPGGLGGVYYTGSVYNVGGAGGSGGGGGCGSGAYTGGPGGSDGSNGSTSTYGDAGGNGQGHTTRAFGDAAGTLYAAGGGGAGGSAGGAGGAGGGGNGAAGIAVGGNATNYGCGGGGEGGGSTSGTGYQGILILRWGY